VNQPSYRAVARRHKQACVVCGARAPLDVHHINRNHQDNRLENLEWRCPVHHRQVHGKRTQTPFAIRFDSLDEAKRAAPLFAGTGASIGFARFGASKPKPARKRSRRAKRRAARKEKGRKGCGCLPFLMVGLVLILVFF